MAFSALTGATALVAQVESPQTPIFKDISLEVGLEAKSIFRGIKRSNEAFSSGVRAELSKLNLYGGAYTVQPFNSSDNSEVDVYLGTRDRLNKYFSYDAGVTGYIYPGKLGGSIRNTIEPYVGLIGQIPKLSGLSASAYVYYDIEREGLTTELAVSYRITLWDQIEVNLSAFGGYVDADNLTPLSPGPDVNESYFYHGVSVEFPFTVNEHIVITVGLNYSNTFNLNPGIDGGDQLWGVGRITYTF